MKQEARHYVKQSNYWTHHDAHSRDEICHIENKARIKHDRNRTIGKETDYESSLKKLEAEEPQQQLLDAS